MPPDRTGGFTAAVAGLCDLCGQPAAHELDAASGQPTPAMIREGRHSLPTRRCAQHLAELLSAWPPGTWREIGQPRPPEQASEPPRQRTPPNPTLSVSGLAHDAPAGGGILASRLREPA